MPNKVLVICIPEIEFYIRMPSCTTCIRYKNLKQFLSALYCHNINYDIGESMNSLSKINLNFRKIFPLLA